VHQLCLQKDCSQELHGTTYSWCGSSRAGGQRTPCWESHLEPLPGSYKVCWLADRAGAAEHAAQAIRAGKKVMDGDLTAAVGGGLQWV